MKSIECMLCVTLVAFLAAGVSVRADEIELRDGSVIKGKVLEERPGESYRIRLSDGSEMVYPVDRVGAVRFGKTKKTDTGAREWQDEDTGVYNAEWFIAPYGAYSIGIGDPKPDDTAGGGLAFHMDLIRLYGEFLTTLDSPNTYYYGGGGDLCFVLLRDGKINPYIGGGGGFYGWSVDGFENPETAYVVEGLAGVRMSYFNLFAKYRRFVWTEGDFGDGWDYIQIGGGLAF